MGLVLVSPTADSLTKLRELAMSPKEIDRISMPDQDDFFRDYVFKRQPIVITNLFERQEISNISTLEDATRAWGSTKIHLQEEYTRAEKTSEPYGSFRWFRETSPGNSGA